MNKDGSQVFGRIRDLDRDVLGDEVPIDRERFRKDMVDLSVPGGVHYKIKKGISSINQILRETVKFFRVTNYF